jgi:hypothetical protein
MQLRRNYAALSLALALSLCVTAACGDDDEPSGSGGTGGAAGGNKGGSGGSGGAKAGTGGTKAGSGGNAGTTPGGFTCTEDPPKDPVKCGGATCAAPDFGMNTCIVPCCIQEGGKELCGSKSTAMMLPTECTLPAKVDADCPQMIDDGNGGTLMGCCSAKLKKCGIISTLRPGCVTESTLVTLPNPLQACTPSSGEPDAGAPDAG